MNYAFFLVLLSAIATVPAVAGSRIIDLKNTYNDYKSEYRKAGSRKDKCHYVDLMRSYAQMIMVEGDASRAIEWNAFLPRTGCRETPLIIDRSTSAGFKKSIPEKQSTNSPLTNCMTFGDLVSINMSTKHIKSDCGEDGYMYIKAHH